MARLALTGGTGFVGQRLIPFLIAEGHELRALARQPQVDLPGLSWVQGDLQNPSALQALCNGCDAVIHLAGVIKGHRLTDFVRGNVDGTAAMLLATHRAGIRRFLHISSLAAQAPHLSHYCRSKAEAEVLVAASGLDWTILRPPGVYGPGDRETLALFKAALGPVLPIPAGKSRISWIYVDDLCAAIVSALNPVMVRQTVEVDDGSGGISHRAFAAALTSAVGRRAKIIALPKQLLSPLGYINQLRAGLSRQAAMLTTGKVREIFHPDWSVADTRLQKQTGWEPKVRLAEGLSSTMSWYRQHGWLQG